MCSYIERWQKDRIEEMLRQRRVVMLSGPRQCGKTTLARSLNGAQFEYRTLDNKTQRDAASADPVSFVKHDADTLIIDEVQREPELLSSIKMVVDEDTRPGQYLLTGSANLNALPSVQESLAGRIAKVRLRPLSQAEISGAKPDFLKRALNAGIGRPTSKVDRDALLEIGLRGGYPEVLSSAFTERRQWHRDYVSTLLDRDLKDILHIRRADAMHKLVQVTAAWSSKLLDVAGITSSLAIKRPTVESYLNALEALYLLERVPAWTKNDYARVAKHPKVFMTDSGLMGSILDWRPAQMKLDADRSGKLAETLVFGELSAQIDTTSDYLLYHYRDWEKREIDFLVERVEDGARLGVEVKASATVRAEDFKHLAWFRDNLAGDFPFQGIVIYAGDEVLSFGDRLTAVPFASMWS
ncbi:ATP-binding protein [Maricaulis sp.]|uniref:ATP-binding protein n=1 Tax=Maricaulis sp. TaxID=1486257 RepID=UPI0032980C0A